MIKRATARGLPAPVAFDADDAELLNQVAAYYHATCKQSPEALAYLESRGLKGASAMDAIDAHRLGYANRSLGLRLPDKSRRAGADIRARLEKLGVYRESGHEHLNGSLVVPLFDAAGQVVNLYGRKIRNDLRPGTPSHLYLPGAHRGVFNRAAFVSGVCDELIVCEALIDALTFWCAGYRNVTSAYGVEGVTSAYGVEGVTSAYGVEGVTSAYGVEGVTDELIDAIQSAGIRRVLIAFDRDEAGERGAAKFAERLLALGIDCYRVPFPKGMDANDYARKVTPASQSLGLVIRKAEWLGKGAGPAREAVDPVAEIAALPAFAEPVSFLAASPHPNPDATTSQSTKPASGQVAGYLPEGEGENPPTLLPLPAAAVPPAPMPDTPAQVTEREIVLVFPPCGDKGDGAAQRRWRVRGLPKNLAVGVLKVNVMASDTDGRFHVDTLDLYAARARAAFVQQAAVELGIHEGVLKTDLGRVLLKLEALQDEAIRDALAPKAAPAPSMSEAERFDALALLQSSDLMARILADFAACGVVGEAVNKQVAYLAAVSRLLDRPLGVVIQSSSAAGKSSLMDAVLAFVPTEAKTQYSAMTGQALFYMGQTSLKHKILALAEEEGASRASYALKLLQSEGELTIASTGADPATGNLVTQEYRVEGPVMLMLTTTAIDLDEELMNRCLVLTVDEDRAQTRAIHRLQREKRTLAGLASKHAKAAILSVHQNAQRLLRPLAVVNPYADRLTFMDDRTRTRRDHEKYLTLIDAIALLHQHQREVKTIHHKDPEAQRKAEPIEYIEVTLADIATANRLAHEVLGRSLDELPPQTRRVLARVVEYVGARSATDKLHRPDIRFTRGELRAASGFGDTQLKLHLARLAELEYLLIHRAERGQGYVYELLFDGDAAAPMHLSGLIDVAALKACEYDGQRLGANAAQSAQTDSPSSTSRAAVGGLSGASRVIESPTMPDAARLTAEVSDEDEKPSMAGVTSKRRSYPQTAAVASSLAVAAP